MKLWDEFADLWRTHTLMCAAFAGVVLLFAVFFVKNDLDNGWHWATAAEREREEWRQQQQQARAQEREAKVQKVVERAYMGKIALRDAARNPDSLVVESVTFTDAGAICYEYRAQNGFGGMNRENAVLAPGADRLKLSDAAWNTHCANRYVTDITGKIP